MIASLCADRSRTHVSPALAKAFLFPSLFLGDGWEQVTWDLQGPLLIVTSLLRFGHGLLAE